MVGDTIRSAAHERCSHGATPKSENVAFAAFDTYAFAAAEEIKETGFADAEEDNEFRKGAACALPLEVRGRLALAKSCMSHSLCAQKLWRNTKIETKNKN